MKDSANAFEGWPIADVFAMPSTARNDVNGKLFAYIYSRLDAFHQHTKTLPVNFCLYQGLVQEAVPSMLLAEKYDRIEVRSEEQLYSMRRNAWLISNNRFPTFATDAGSAPRVLCNCLAHSSGPRTRTQHCSRYT